MARVPNSAEKTRQERTLITPPMNWFTRELSVGLSLGSEQSATGGAGSYGWSRQLRVEQAATGGAVSYGRRNDDDWHGQISDASLRTPRFLLSPRF